MAPLRAFLIAVYIGALVVFTLALIDGIPVLPLIAALISFVAFVLACRVNDAMKRQAEAEVAR